MVSQHYLERAKERMGLNQSKAIRMEDIVFNRGLLSDDLPKKERTYLASKETDESLPRFYNGYIFIYNVEGLCLTVYKAPEWFGKKGSFEGKRKIRDPWKYRRYSLDVAS